MGKRIQARDWASDQIFIASLSPEIQQAIAFESAASDAEVAYARENSDYLSVSDLLYRPVLEAQDACLDYLSAAVSPEHLVDTVMNFDAYSAEWGGNVVTAGEIIDAAIKTMQGCNEHVIGIDIKEEHLSQARHLVQAIKDVNLLQELEKAVSVDPGCAAFGKRIKTITRLLSLIAPESAKAITTILPFAHYDIDQAADLSQFGTINDLERFIRAAETLRGNSELLAQWHGQLNEAANQNNVKQLMGSLSQRGSTYFTQLIIFEDRLRQEIVHRNNELVDLLGKIWVFLPRLVACYEGIASSSEVALSVLAEGKDASETEEIVAWLEKHVIRVVAPLSLSNAASFSSYEADEEVEVTAAIEREGLYREALVKAYQEAHADKKEVGEDKAGQNTGRNQKRIAPADFFQPCPKQAKVVNKENKENEGNKENKGKEEAEGGQPSHKGA